MLPEVKFVWNNGYNIVNQNSLNLYKVTWHIEKIIIFIYNARYIGLKERVIFEIKLDIKSKNLELNCLII